MVSKLQHVFYYVQNVGRQQVEVIQNLEDANIRNIRHCEARHREYKEFKLRAVKIAAIEVAKLAL
jgi:hypothetical protein